MLPGEECCVPMVSTAPMTVGRSFCEPVQNTTPLDEHLLLTPNARDGHLNAPSAVTLTPAGLCPRPEAGPTGQRQSRVPTGGPTIASSSRRCGFACSLAGNLKSPTPGLVRLQQRRHQQPARREEQSTQSLRHSPHRRQQSSLLCQRFSEMKDAWTVLKAEDIQGYGKACGSDAIPAEINRYGDPQLMDHLTALFQKMQR
nr:unnamed protein product [Spirometra erinaceieuropaei]